jgi:hypothetical protein
VLTGRHHTHSSSSGGGTVAGSAGPEQQLQQQQQQQQQAAEQGGCQLGFDPQNVPYLAVLSHCRQQQQQLPQQQQCAGVVCGDAVALSRQLQRQHVLFLDPPWGGPNYMQPQQQQQQQQQEEEDQVPSCSDNVSEGQFMPHQGGAMSMMLGGVKLSDLCVGLASKCDVLAARLPSRFHDLKQFAQAVLQQLGNPTQNLHRQSESGCGCESENVASVTGRAKSVTWTAVSAGYGRSCLVMFVRAPAGGILVPQLQDSAGRHCMLAILGST